MKLVKFEEERHYEEIQSWWKSHEWPVLPLSALPQNGLVVEADGSGLMLVAGWLYLTDSSMSVLEWVISNPHSTREIRSGAIPFLINGLVNVAKKNKKEFVFTMTENKSLIQHFKDCEFGAEEVMTNLTRRIQ